MTVASSDQRLHLSSRRILCPGETGPLGVAVQPHHSRRAALVEVDEVATRTKEVAEPASTPRATERSSGFR